MSETRSERMIRLNTTHGMSHYPGYGRWKNMINRCLNPDDRDYPNYGGRGITVCPRWRVFELYWKDMGAPPEGLQLERKNNDGDYEPENVVWATPLEQAQNRRIKSTAILNWNLVNEIRGRAEHGEAITSIARRMGFRYHLIYGVVCNARWKE